MATYTNTPDPHDDLVEALAILFNIAIFAWLIAWLTSCSPRTITVPEYHTEYIVKADTLVKHDSIYHRDSVSFYLQGETICRDRYKYIDRYKYVYKTTTDTLIKTDSIRVPVPMDRQLSKWEQTKMDVGGWCMAALAGVVVTIVAYLIYKKKWG